MKKRVMFIIFVFLLFPIVAKASENEKKCYYKHTENGMQMILTIYDSTKSVGFEHKMSLNGGGYIESINYNYFKDSCPQEVYFNICYSMMEGINRYSVTLDDITNNTDDLYEYSCKSDKHILEKGFISSDTDNSKQPGSNIPENSGNTKPTVTVNCSYLFGDPNNSNEIAYWLQWSLDLIKYIGIIALFGLSTFDFVKALIQNDQDAIKKAGTTAAKRFIYCVLLFFLPIIVDYAMTLLGAYGTCNIG